MLVFIMVSQKLVQAMLSKVSEDTITMFSNVSVYDGNTTRSASDGTNILSSWRRLTIPFTKFTYQVTYNISWTNAIRAMNWYTDQQSGVSIKWPWIWIAINWVMDDNTLTKWGDNQQHTDAVSYTITPPAKSDIELWLTNWETGSLVGWVQVTNLTAKATFILSKGTGLITGKSLNNIIKWIWNKIDFVFLWRYTEIDYIK